MVQNRNGLNLFAGQGMAVCEEFMGVPGWIVFDDLGSATAPSVQFEEVEQVMHFRLIRLRVLILSSVGNSLPNRRSRNRQTPDLADNTAKQSVAGAFQGPHASASSSGAQRGP